MPIIMELSAEDLSEAERKFLDQAVLEINRLLHDKISKAGLEFTIDQIATLFVTLTLQALRQKKGVQKQHAQIWLQATTALLWNAADRANLGSPPAH